MTDTAGEKDWREEPGLYCRMETTMGTIAIRLFPDKAPKTVANFVELATGKREWVNPKTGMKTKSHFYDGLIFHRVIPEFMIQGGDPLGTGMGGPGYEFADEIHPDLKFDRTGLLAMANSGPNTNGSQFFITVSRPDWLNGKHTIFGEVVAGYDVAVKISQVRTGPNDRPVTDVVLKKVTIEEVKQKG